MSVRHELKRLERMAVGVIRAADEPEPTSWHPCPVAVAIRAEHDPVIEGDGDTIAWLTRKASSIRLAADHSRTCAACVPTTAPTSKNAPARWKRYHAAWNAWWGDRGAAA